MISPKGLFVSSEPSEILEAEQWHPHAGQSQGQTQGHTQGILAKLQSIVQVNQLHRFYQPQQLQTLAQRVEQTVDFNALAAR